MDTPSTSTSQETATAHSKRNRVQLSCTPCRHAKLKCDRAQPCSQCQKKDRVGSCSYPTPLPRKKAAMTMHKRLKHLESLVKDVMNSQQSDGPHTPPRDGQEPENLVARAEALGIPAEDQRSNTAGNSLSSLDKSSTIQQTTPPPGQIVIGGKETQYVGATHWAAILNDIGEVREYFDEGEDDDVEEETGPETTLLFNTDAPPTKAKLLAALPARRVVDRTVQGYFHGANPALPGEESPDERASQMQTIRTYRRNCIQCIRLSDYTKPGKYTIEAILAHLEGEFMLNDSNQVNCYVVLGVAVRLALRMGLHRDPDRVGGQITPFQGEMRRRLWAVLRQIDLLSSFHIGLPSMVESVDSDVQLPRNLNDSDFDEDCTELPPARPDSEVTSISYVRFKNKICQVFGKIATHANSLSPPSYDEVMELDSQLDAVQATIPPSFRFQPIDSCVADPAQLIIQRLNIAHLLCKSRCVLHRKYIVSNQDYVEREYSVNVSIDAAMQLLDLQKQTYEATQPGGVLARDRCFPSSLTMHDFLLAAMIVYMKTMRILEEEIRESPRNGLCLGASCRKRKLDMISALKMSSDSWQVTQMRYPEFKRAADVLSVMMRKIGTASVALGESQISWGINSGTNDTDSMADRFAMNQATINPLEAVPWSMDSSAPAPNSSYMNLETTQPIPPQTDSLNESAPFDSLMDIPTDFDWELFDSHIRADANQLPMHDQHLPDIDLGVEGMNDFEFGFVQGDCGNV
ncbi:putative c6 transcription protein [Botrytis cinerea BcDW1]|uniref:Putative c6 transcription protein n=1 Tax=Botryotinia fuckeliana (strain BcDW1) TaxID=1290391 RepID=M7TWT0_BOTF1|nr:putative c6 transcription protein [Botrytis cinerea BcDW1]